MDAVIQVEASELRTVVTFAEVTIVRGKPIVPSSTWITVLFDQLRLIKESLWANAPNEAYLTTR